MGIGSYSTTPGSNTTVPDGGSGINIAEGCAPANLNNALRQIMADIAVIKDLVNVTASAAELNLLDGVTASTAELNILDGVTASAAELNLMDGFTGIDTTATDVTTKFPNSRAVVRGRGFTYAADQATTSGTAFDFGSIPSWVTEIIIHFDGVSLSGSDSLGVQIGPGGTPVTTGYNTVGTLIGASTVDSEESTSSFRIRLGSASNIARGFMLLSRFPGTDTWQASHVIRLGTTSLSVGAGAVSLVATLDIVRITRSGSNTFDAGSVVVGWR